ncbi:MAG: Crp/Fnr family transcriptional regulator [Proteobacteria bacterium]|nr:Crp/Fnr family transcriptional regulator [Pseudomonadota bacterium]
MAIEDDISLLRLSARADKPDEPELVIGPGTLVGEYSLLIETKRAVTATAIEPSTVIRISRNLFLKTLEGFPDAAGRLRKMVAARAEQMTADMQGVRKWLGEAPNYR